MGRLLLLCCYWETAAGRCCCNFFQFWEEQWYDSMPRQSVAREKNNYFGVQQWLINTGCSETWHWLCAYWALKRKIEREKTLALYVILHFSLDISSLLLKNVWIGANPPQIKKLPITILVWNNICPSINQSIFITSLPGSQGELGVNPSIYQAKVMDSCPVHHRATYRGKPGRKPSERINLHTQGENMQTPYRQKNCKKNITLQFITKSKLSII